MMFCGSWCLSLLLGACGVTFAEIKTENKTQFKDLYRFNSFLEEYAIITTGSKEEFFGVGF